VLISDERFTANLGDGEMNVTISNAKFPLGETTIRVNSDPKLK